MSKLCCLKRGGSLLAQISGGRGGHPPTNFGVRKLESRAVTWRCLRDPTFSRFDTIPACDTHTHTDRHTMMAITRALLALRG